NDAHRQVHPDRLRRGRPQGGGVRRRRGPTGTWCCHRPQVLPVDARAVMSGATASPALDELPLRPELVGEVPYGAPQLDVAVCLNVNENPYPPSERVLREISAAVPDGAP